MQNLLKIFIFMALGMSHTYADNKTRVENNLPELTTEASVKNQAAADSLAKDAKCTRCHDETETKPILSIYQTAHGNKADSRTPSCQSCHGDSEKHLSGAMVNGIRATPDVVFGKNTSLIPSSDVNSQTQACLGCHSKDQKRSNWKGGAHQVADVACTSCHQIHTPHDNVRDKKTQPEVCFTCHQTQRSDTRKFSHHPITEGKVACAECHNPHGSTAPKQLIKNTVTETCFTCHADKRGPFLWEHQPVTEDCTNCHTPHGSNITPLLKSRAPFLCDECHDGPHASPNPAAGNTGGIQGGLTGSPANPSSSYTGRACLNCHSMVHGSNDPAGAFLQR